MTTATTGTTTHLSLAPSFGEGELEAFAPDPVIPGFEGHKVKSALGKLTSVSKLEIDDEVMAMDDLVALAVVGRVTRVDHIVDERSGELHRVQTIKVIQAKVLGLDDPMQAVE